MPRSAPRRFGTNSRSGAGPPVPLAAPAHEGDDGRDWTVHDLRLHVERYLLTEGTRLDTELLGTLVTDEDHLTVLVRYAGSHPVGHHVQSVHFDLSELREEAGVTTLDVARDEVLHGAIHFLDMHEIGIDDHGIRHWR